jgi:hypothetical protein
MKGQFVVRAFGPQGVYLRSIGDVCGDVWTAMKAALDIPGCTHINVDFYSLDVQRAEPEAEADETPASARARGRR